jgi:hypothetical protein
MIGLPRSHSAPVGCRQERRLTLPEIWRYAGISWRRLRPSSRSTTASHHARRDGQPRLRVDPAALMMDGPATSTMNTRRPTQAVPRNRRHPAVTSLVEFSSLPMTGIRAPLVSFRRNMKTSWMANHEDALKSVIVNCQANWRPRLPNPTESSLHDIRRKDRRRPFGAG